MLLELSPLFPLDKESIKQEGKEEKREHENTYLFVS